MKRFGFFMMALTLFATLFGSTAMAAERNAKKTLIIYYSNTGTTKLVAERLQKKTNADIYVIETVKTYSTKDPERTQVPKKELETGNLPALKKSPPNMSSYDLILVGGPVWWYTVSTPMMSFLRDADFAGKRVAPFNTNKGGNGDYIGPLGGVGAHHLYQGGVGLVVEWIAQLQQLVGDKQRPQLLVVAHTLKGQERKAGKQNTAGYAGVEQIGPELALAGAGVVNDHAPERHQEDADDGGDHSQLDQIAVLQPQGGAGQQTGGR